jgi:hypothetical protein
MLYSAHSDAEIALFLTLLGAPVFATEDGAFIWLEM